MGCKPGRVSAQRNLAKVALSVNVNAKLPGSPSLRQIRSRLAIEYATEMPLSRAQLLVLLVIAAITATSGFSQSRAVYTAAQAADGFAAYQTNCANCHLPDLTGRNE